MLVGGSENAWYIGMHGKSGDIQHMFDEKHGIWGKSTIHGKWGDTVNRDTVNREMTVKLFYT